MRLLLLCLLIALAPAASAGTVYYVDDDAEQGVASVAFGDRWSQPLEVLDQAGVSAIAPGVTPHSGDHVFGVSGAGSESLWTSITFDVPERFWATIDAGHSVTFKFEAYGCFGPEWEAGQYSLGFYNGAGNPEFGTMGYVPTEFYAWQWRRIWFEEQVSRRTRSIRVSMGADVSVWGRAATVSGVLFDDIKASLASPYVATTPSSFSKIKSLYQ